jgi:hypothetical protein
MNTVRLPANFVLSTILRIKQSKQFVKGAQRKRHRPSFPPRFVPNAVLDFTCQQTKNVWNVLLGKSVRTVNQSASNALLDITHQATIRYAIHV